MQILLHTVEETEQYGAELIRMLPKQSLVFLHGNLGAGKTTLVRGYLRAAGYQGTIKSPTYNIVEEYVLPSRKVFHFDLYRLNDPEELEWLGVRDYFQQECVCFVEWPEHGKGFLPQPDYIVTLDIIENSRRLTMQALLTC